MSKESQVMPFRRQGASELTSDGLVHYDDWGYPGCPIEQDGAPNPGVYGKILWRNKWTIVAVAFSVALLSVLATIPQSPRYKATTKIEIQTINSGYLNMDKLSPVQESDAHELSPLGDIPTQLEILKSQSVIDKAALHFDSNYVIRRQQEGVESAGSMLLKRIVSLFKAVPPEEKALNTAIESIKAKPAPETRVVDITSESTSPALARDFVNHLTDEYIQQNLAERTNMNQRTQEWLSAQIEEMRGKLERSEMALQTYVRSAGLIVADETGSKVSEQQLLNVQTELTHAQADLAAQEARYEIARQAPLETLGDILDNEQLRQYQARSTELRQQLADLKTIYAEGSPKVQRVQAQLTEVQAAMARERQVTQARIGNDFEQAKHRESVLLSQYARQAGIVTADAERSVQFNVLRREVDSNRQLYDSNLQQVKQAAIASAIHASNVRVIDRAEMPHNASSPNRSLYGAAGLVFGFALGVGFVLRRELSDRSFQSPNQARQILGLPELGVIPTIEARCKRWFEAGGLAIPRLLPQSQRPLPALPASSPEPDPMVIESFRAAMASILFSGDANSRPRVVVVSSINPGEGKSFVTANLAATLGESGHKVLIIDADMRKPQQGEIFNVPNDRGLSTILAESPEGEIQTMEAFVRPTDVPNLSLIPSGQPSSGGAGLLCSPKMAALLESARKSYDLILIDTPPMLNLPDARVVGRLSDGLILVLRSRRTSRDAAQFVCQRLSEDRTQLLGTILNDWNPCNDETMRFGYSQPARRTA